MAILLFKYDYQPNEISMPLGGGDYLQMVPSVMIDAGIWLKAGGRFVYLANVNRALANLSTFFGNVYHWEIYWGQREGPFNNKVDGMSVVDCI